MKCCEKLKNFWNKIVAWVKGAASKTDEFILKYAPVAVSVVNWIKEFNESSAVDIIEAVLTKVGQEYGVQYIELVRKWLTENLPKIIDALKLLEETASYDTIAEKIVAAEKAIRLLPESLNATTWTTLSTLLANSIADDGKLSLSEAFAIVAYVYENHLNK